MTFVSKYSDFFLRMTQHVIYSQVYACNHERKHVAGGGGGGGGGGNCCQRGAMGEWGGGGQLAPTPKAMLDPGLHDTYLDLSCSSPSYHLHCTPFYL